VVSFHLIFRLCWCVYRTWEGHVYGCSLSIAFVSVGFYVDRIHSLQNVEAGFNPILKNTGEHGLSDTGSLPERPIDSSSG
jgi:hypothetical protein